MPYTLKHSWLRNADVGVAAARMPLFQEQLYTDSVSHTQGMVALNLIGDLDTELAIAMTEFGWFADGLSDAPRGRSLSAELKAARHLQSIAEASLELARAVWGLDWVSGGEMTEEKSAALGYLALLAENRPEQAELVVSQGGPDRERAALGTALRYVSAPVLEDFLDSYFAQSATITLPLAGKINLWAFDHDPFPPGGGEEVLAIMEASARGAEQLFGSPFPMNDIIMVVQDDKYEWEYGGEHYGDSIRVRRYGSIADADHVFHEIGHYYWTPRPSGGWSNDWLVEGIAELVQDYVRIGLVERRLALNNPRSYPPFGLRGDETLERQLREAAEAVYAPEHGCAARGVENVHALSTLDKESWGGCEYALGRYLLLSLFDLLGETALSPALRELHLWDSDAITEEQVYRVFLEHTPPGLEDEFHSLYRRIHGGPFIDS